eukprot:1288764-Pyramimonas_sp.AAC.1
MVIFEEFIVEIVHDMVKCWPSRNPPMHPNWLTRPKTIKSSNITTILGLSRSDVSCITPVPGLSTRARVAATPFGDKLLMHYPESFIFTPQFIQCKARPARAGQGPCILVSKRSLQPRERARAPGFRKPGPNYIRITV